MWPDFQIPIDIQYIGWRLNYHQSTFWNPARIQFLPVSTLPFLHVKHLWVCGDRDSPIFRLFDGYPKSIVDRSYDDCFLFLFNFFHNIFPMLRVFPGLSYPSGFLFLYIMLTNLTRESDECLGTYGVHELK